MFGVIAAAIFAYLGVLVFILEGWAVLEAVCPKPTGVSLHNGLVVCAGQDRHIVLTDKPSTC